MSNVVLKDATRKKPDAIALATKGRQTSHEGKEVSAVTKPSVRVG